MTKLCLSKLDDKLQFAVRELLPLYSAVEDEDGVIVEWNEGADLKIEASAKKVLISSPFKAAFFRGIMLYLTKCGENSDFVISEKICIPECGVMLDFSRNGVMRIGALKEYVREMAIRGLNVLHLYMEDVYPMPEHPYFGYMRGRYTADELREIDRYALQLGVEVIPNIQTLGHMEQYIKWDEGMQYRDTASVLIAGEEKTYKLIDDMLRNLSEIFTTKRVHLGMDEAGNLGSGRYYGKNGYVPRSKILLDHLKRVLELTEKYGLEPIVYGDTIYSTLNGEQYSSKLAEVPAEIKEQIDGKMQLVYWDYYKLTQESYEETMKGYMSITKNFIFWGGIWTWFGFMPDNRYTWDTATPALYACKKLGVKSAVASIWSNNGTECNHFLTVWGLQLYAEHMYNETVSEEHLKEYFEKFSGASYDAFMEMSYFHNDFDRNNDYDNYPNRYMGKRFVWSDILVGLMDADLKEKPMSDYYAALSAKFGKYKEENTRWSYWYSYSEKLFELVSKKCYISERIKDAYDNNDKAFLNECVNTLLPELREKYKALRNIHKEQWMSTYKPFGWEVLDVRYGGLVNRITCAEERLRDYLDGKISAIEELDAERLLHRCEWTSLSFASQVTACYTV